MRIPLIVVIGLFLFAAKARAGEVSGAYANQLSQYDIAQIKSAVSKEPGVQHNIRKIEVVRPDKVVIETGGRTALDSATYYDFTVSKHSGKWTVDPSSIEITTEPRNNHGLDSDATGR